MIPSHFWTDLLGPAGLESPGFQECLKDCRENPYRKPSKKSKGSKGSSKKSTGGVKFPSLKHSGTS